MAIISSVIVINMANGSELDRRIREIHTDHLGVPFPNFNYTILLNASGNIIDTDGNILFNSLADKTAANAVIAEERLAAKEIQQWIADMEAGLDPAHIDMGGYFVHSVPDFNTWEIAVDGAVTPLLQKLYMQDILLCKLTCSRLTNKELEDIAGKPNDVLSEQTIATNTQEILDAYVPLIDEEGLPRG